jgi:hypothetical protein
MTGHTLTVTQSLLADYLNDERAAIAIAAVLEVQGVDLPVDASPETVENVVITALVTVREAMTGPSPKLEYVTGERRDLIRVK